MGLNVWVGWIVLVDSCDFGLYHSEALSATWKIIKSCSLSLLQRLTISYITRVTGLELHAQRSHTLHGCSHSIASYSQYSTEATHKHISCENPSITKSHRNYPRELLSKNNRTNALHKETNGPMIGLKCDVVHLVRCKSLTCVLGCILTWTPRTPLTVCRDNILLKAECVDFEAPCRFRL